MSNIRDLIKLKGVRHIPIIADVHMKSQRISNNAMVIDRLDGKSEQIKKQKTPIKQRDNLTFTSTNKIHKRGISFGTPQPGQSRKFNFNHNPRLSIYNFTMRLDAKDQEQLNHQDDTYIIPLTDRKIKNNYVNCKQLSPYAQALVIHSHHNNMQTEMSKKLFQIYYPIGKGGFGKVWKVQLKSNKQIFAMKQMSKAKVINKKSVTSVINQRNFLARLSHPYLVNMWYAFQDREYLFLVMDYLDGGDLRYHIGNRQFFSQKQTKFFLSNIILSLEYLHKHKIIHRDLKPQNLVFDSQGYLRITDLGISREFREDNHQDTSGTPGYMAPQVMVRRSHSYAVDYFALGVIAYQLMLGRRPYIGSNRKQIKQQILYRQASVKLDQLPYKWSPHALDFINKLLIRNPDNRLGTNGIDDIKNHPWMGDVDWQKLQHKKVKPPFKPKSIEEDYQNYKQQISEDTIIKDEDEVTLLLRKKSTQQLFEGYYFQRESHHELFEKKRASYPTNSTEENIRRK